MINKLGMFLRKLRIDNNEIMKDMAKKINVSTSFLSAVENGKKNIPGDWYNKIVKIYNLKEDDKKNLKEAIDLSMTSINISFNNLTEDQKKLSILFKNNINKLNDEQIEKLISFYNDI